FEPATYCRIVARVSARTPKAAFNRGLHAIDLQRAIWCMMGNLRMQLAFGSAQAKPINVVRLGSRHTLHLANGQRAYDGLWFEPGFTEARIFRPRRSRHFSVQFAMGSSAHPVFEIRRETL